jgi:asparagine synthase (glutamine-hydrolysing)
MCGIAGYADATGPSVSLTDLVDARDALTHRGPDDAGIWTNTDGRVGLATRRLRVIDLSEQGHQPLVGADENVISFNGEIYNYRELRGMLTEHRFRSSSDTEVITAAYAEWGADFVERLNGMFALALADGRRNQLILARDRAGEKPLYYRLRGSQLVFASEVKALLRFPGSERRLDPDGLNEFLAFGYQRPDQSAFAGIRKLPPGHIAVYDLQTGRFNVQRYWQLPTWTRSDKTDACGKLEQLLEESVRLRLVADVPLGVSLSGGVDSSLVTALAARHSTRAISTFTVGFEHETVHDERPFARIVAEQFETEHHELLIDRDVSGLLPGLIDMLDEPLADSSILPTYAIARLIRQHVTVVLGGDGGDELFGGYGHYRRVLQLASARHIPGVVRGAIAAGVRAALPIGRPGRTFLTGLEGDEVSSFMATVTLFGERDRAWLLTPRMRSMIDDSSAPERRRRLLTEQTLDPIDRLTRLDFLTYLPDDILTKVDRATMQMSLEARAPWLDHSLIEFAFGAVRSEDKVRGLQLKWLPKQLAAKLLPSLPIQRKQGFSIPLHKWIVDEWREYLDTAIRTLEDSDVIERGRARNLIQGQLVGHSNSERLFALLSLGQWMLKYRVLA